MVNMRMMAVSMAVAATSAFAAGNASPGPSVTVNNTTANPVPITGTVTLQGGIGAVTGAVESADQNIVLHDAIIEVSSPVFGNAQTPQSNVKDFKEVRLVVQRGSCTGCGDPIEVAVFVTGNTGLSYQIDQFSVTNPAVGVGFFATRTYSVPGESMSIALRASKSGTTTSVRVLLVGRAN